MKASVFIFTLLSLVMKGYSHPIHVSIVNMDIQADSCALKYSIRLFYDDFQALINSKYNTSLDFQKEKRISLKEQEYILDYLNSAFIVSDSTHPSIKPDFLGWKLENMSIWFYFGMNFSRVTQVIFVENNLMNSVFTDQKNLMIVNNRMNEEGFEFNQRITKYRISVQ